MTEYTSHPAAELFPLMGEEELASSRERHQGQQPARADMHA